MSTITATFKELITEIPSTGNMITHKLFSSNNDIWCDIVCTGSEGSFITMQITGYSEVFKYRLLPNLTVSINLKGIISRMINYNLTRLNLTDLQERTDTIKKYQITFSYGAATDVKTLTVLKTAQQVQSTYGEFASEYAILDVDSTEEQYKMKFLSCFENPVIYTKTEQVGRVYGDYEFTESEVIEIGPGANKKYDINKKTGAPLYDYSSVANYGSVIFDSNTSKTVPSIDYWFTNFINYKSIINDLTPQRIIIKIRLKYVTINNIDDVTVNFLINASYPEPNVIITKTLQNVIDESVSIGGGWFEYTLIAEDIPVNYYYSLVSITFESLTDPQITPNQYYVLMDNYKIMNVEGSDLSEYRVTPYPFTLDFIHSENGLAYKERVLKTHQTGAGLIQTQQTDKYIYPTNEIAVIDLQMNDYLAATTQNNVDKYLSVWLEEGLEPFFEHNRTADNLTVSFYLDTKDELGSDTAIIDWGDGTVENITIETNSNGGTVFTHEYESVGDYVVSLKYTKNKIYTINITDDYADNRLIKLFTKKEWVNLYYLYLSNNQLTEITVNNILILENNKNQNYKYIYLEGGTNAAPTGDGITAKNALISRGYTVTTN